MFSHNSKELPNMHAAQLFYRALERDKPLALKVHTGNFNAT